MLKLISLVTTTHLALVLLDGLVPRTHAFLPLGGTELSQIGALFAGALVLYGLFTIFSRRPLPFP